MKVPKCKDIIASEIIIESIIGLLCRQRKAQSEGERIMSETRFTEFPALSVDRGLGFLDLHRRPMLDNFAIL